MSKPSQRVVSFHYVLTNSKGEEIDRSEGDHPLAFMENSGQIIPGLEVELLKMKAGEKRTVKVDAADAYGERDESMIVEVPLDKFPVKGVKVGDMFRTGTEEEPQIVCVAAVNGTTVKLDGNHPLAGENLTFAVEVVEIRPATAEEMAHGHCHGPDCDH